jgi:hypothetical protein
MSYKQPLPPGLSPILAGRYGLWLVSRRSHRAALRRTAFPKRVWRKPNFANRFTDVILPWSCAEYPGASLWLAQYLGVTPATARHWLYGKGIPARHALRLPNHLRAYAVSALRLAEEMEMAARAMQQAQTMKGRAPRLMNGIARW